MAFFSSTNWEIQTGGADTAGGGFDTGSGGTDYTYGGGQTTIAYTDLVIDGVSSTKATSVARPFVNADAGNIINIASGTGFTVQRVQIQSVSAGAAIFDKSLGTLGSTGGTGTLGGALASPGMVAGVMAAGNDAYIKAGTYTVTSASTNIANGCVSSVAGASAANTTKWFGYNATRGDGGTKPIIKASGISTFTLFTAGATNRVENIEFDANSLSGGTCMRLGSTGEAYRCRFKNFTAQGVVATGTGSHCLLCEATGGSAVAFNTVNAISCTAYSNTATPFQSNSGIFLSNCVAVNNSGASTDGFAPSASGCRMINCTAYGNGRHGFNMFASTSPTACLNCYAEGNAGYGFTASAAYDLAYLYLCGGYNNTSGNVNNTNIPAANVIGFITLTTTAFTNAAGNDFSLNNVGTGGALLRAAGIPGLSSGAYGLPGLSTNAYPDIGAVQHPDPAGAGLLVHRGMAGGFSG